MHPGALFHTAPLLALQRGDVQPCFSCHSVSSHARNAIGLRTAPLSGPGICWNLSIPSVTDRAHFNVSVLGRDTTSLDGQDLVITTS